MSDSNKKKPLPIINKPARKKTKKVVVHVSETAFLNIQKQIAFIQKYDTVLSGSIKTVEDFIAFHVEHLSKYFTKNKIDFFVSGSEISTPNVKEEFKSQQNMIFEALNFVDQVNKDNPKIETVKISEVAVNPPMLNPDKKLISIKLSEPGKTYIDVPERESDIACFSEREFSTEDRDSFVSKFMDYIENWTASEEDIKNGSIQIKDEDPEEIFNKKTKTYDDDQDYDE